MKADDLDRIIDSAIDCLINDQPSNCVDCLVELCAIYKRAGMDFANFKQTRFMIIAEAEKKTSILFIKEKLIAAEREAQQKRVLWR